MSERAIPQRVCERGVEGERVFSTEIKRALEAAKYSVYTLTGRLIRDIRKNDLPIFTHSVGNNFDELCSTRGQVAVFPDIILPGSYGLDFSRQKTMIEGLTLLDGTKIGLGSLADYLELIFQLRKNNQNPFGQKYDSPLLLQKNHDSTVDSPYTRTMTSFGYNKICIGAVGARGVNIVLNWKERDCFPNLGVFPLIFPAGR